MSDQNSIVRYAIYPGIRFSICILQQDSSMARR